VFHISVKPPPFTHQSTAKTLEALISLVLPLYLKSRKCPISFAIIFLEYFMYSNKPPSSLTGLLSAFY
jgi:hypothetical protein